MIPALTAWGMTVKPRGVPGRFCGVAGVQSSSGQVAQLVEQGIENPRVGGSIPSLATPSSLRRPIRTWMMVAAVLVVQGCGDNCEQLCGQLGTRIDTCKPETLDWVELGARSRADYVGSCRDDWEAEASNLTASDLRVALDVCDDSSRVLTLMSCDEVSSLYLSD